jgi:hypothetical protein
MLSEFSESTFAQLIVFGPIVIGVLGGIWAVSRLRRSTTADLLDLGRARRLARALGVLAGVVTGAFLAFAAAYGSAWAGRVDPVLVVLFALLGIPAGIGIRLVALFGYAVLARPRVGRSALSGVLLGPILILGMAYVGISVVQALEAARFARNQADEEARNQFWQAQSAQLHVSVEDVDVDLVSFRDLDTGLPRTGIQTARLTLVLRPEVDLHVDSHAHTPFSGAFRLFPIDPPVRGCVLEGKVRYVDVSALLVGAETRIALTLVAPGGCQNQPAPGAFEANLRLDTSTDGYPGAYAVTIPLTITGS